jgi:hypothetical protein
MDRRSLPTAPAFLLGDVLRWLQPETFMLNGNVERKHALRYVTQNAFAATARLAGVYAENLLHEQYRPGGREVVIRGAKAGIVSGKRRREIPLLPIAMELADEFLEHRPENEDPRFFLKESGLHCPSRELRRPMRQMSTRLGFDHDLTRRLYQFFDRALDAASDRPAVVALRGFRERTIDRRVRDADIEAALADPDRLRKVLEDHHPLAGPAGRFLGERARKLVVDVPKNLSEIRPQPVKPSPAMKSDPVVAELRARGPRKRGRGARSRLKELRQTYFDHVDDLWHDGDLKQREVEDLFDISKRVLFRWRAERVDALRTEADREEEGRRREVLIEDFRCRPNGEILAAFKSRTEPRNSDWMWLIATIKATGELPRRRGRPRKRQR